MIAVHPLAVALLAAGVNARSLTFDTKSADFSKYGGLYQSTFSEKTGNLYVTNSVGRPPVKVSDLIEVNPDTLEVVRDVQPAFDNSNVTQRYAVYGITKDDKNGLIWVTNTRQGTVAYYNDEDLSLGNQYPSKLQPQPRDVYVDTNTQLAYVSSATSDVLNIFSKDKKDGIYKRLNISTEAGRKFQGVMSLVADEEAEVLYTVSLRSNLAAAIDLNSHKVKTFELGEQAERASGVAWDSKRKHLFVANQGSNNTLVLDPSNGQIIKDIKVPAGPLNALYDPTFDVVYVASRLGHAVSVIDPETYEIITELKVQTPNHISLGKGGEVFVTDKSNSSLLYKFSPHEDGANNTKTTSASASQTSVASKVASGSEHASKTADANAGASGEARASKSASGGSSDAGKTSVHVANAAASLAAPVTVGAIAAMALLI